jgi:hypothetical protein
VVNAAIWLLIGVFAVGAGFCLGWFAKGLR